MPKCGGRELSNNMEMRKTTMWKCVLSDKHPPTPLGSLTGLPNWQCTLPVRNSSHIKDWEEKLQIFKK